MQFACSLTKVDWVFIPQRWMIASHFLWRYEISDQFLEAVSLLLDNWIDVNAQNN
jgi:hypothetical protein